MEGLYGPKFKVLYEFKSPSNGADCRIVTEDEKKPGMMRGESWDAKDKVWRQWLQSTEAALVYEGYKSIDMASQLQSEVDSLKAERDALKAEKGK